MIDTVIMIIPFSQAVIINVARFGGEDAINSVLTSYVPRNGRGTEIHVTITKFDKQACYTPRISLAKTNFPIDDSNVNYKIECSLP